eukprot:g7955.t1
MRHHRSGGSFSSASSADSSCQGKLRWRPKRVYEDGRTYEGQWLGGSRKGKGIERSRYGDFVYEGEFVDDKYEGLGCMRWSNGCNYVGDFWQNQKHGRGHEKYATGDEYRVGRDQMVSPYRGQFLHNLPHGRGSYTKKDGAVIRGLFHEGRLVEAE